MMQNKVQRDLHGDQLVSVGDDIDKPRMVDLQQPACNDDSVESLSTRFNDEIEAWARRALHTSGFGDW